MATTAPIPAEDHSGTKRRTDPAGDRRRFDALVQQWRRETAMLSSAERKAMHPAYQSIIGMGDAAVPLMLHEMTQKPGHWFWALRAITGADPVRPDNAGNVAAMTEDWLRWGREHHYL